MKPIKTAVLAFFFCFSLAPPCTGATGTKKVFTLTPLTVSARKVEENIQKVPIGVDAFSAARIEEARIGNTYDLTRFSPNTHMKYNYYENQVVIRGLSTIRASIYSPAAFYLDDVCYPLQFMQNAELFDIERAEILKGPQGTLYGRNAESGVVKITTRAPGNLFHAGGSAEYGSYDTVKTRASISGPVIPGQLYMGGALQYKRSDGYVENLSNGNEESADLRHLNGRASLRWTPTDRLDISYIADAMDADDHCGGHRFISGPQATEAYTHRSDQDEYYRQSGSSHVLRVKHDGGGFNLLSVTGLVDNTLKKLNDTDLWDNPANRRYHTNKFEERQYSQEIRIFSPKGKPWQWMAGLYGFIDETDIDYHYHIASANREMMNPVAKIDSSGGAVFGQGTYTLFDRLRLTAGIRLDHQNLDGDVFDRVNDKRCRAELTYNEILPKFSAAYDASDDTMIYATASKGYLVGGYNWTMTPRRQTFTYDPEYAWNFEAGIKSAWLGNRLTANLSAFYIRIDDKQVMEYDWNTLAKTISNAARAHSSGIELQLEAMPLRGLEVSAGFGYNEARFDEFSSTEMIPGAGLIEKIYDGNDLPYAPKTTYNVGVQYKWASGYTARADLLGTGSFYGDAANQSAQEAYQTVNLRLGREGKRLSWHLWADNVFDEQYLTFVYSYRQYAMGLDGPPRTVGASLTWRF